MPFDFDAGKLIMAASPFYVTHYRGMPQKRISQGMETRLRLKAEAGSSSNACQLKENVDAKPNHNHIAQEIGRHMYARCNPPASKRTEASQQGLPG